MERICDTVRSGGAHSRWSQRSCDTLLMVLFLNTSACSFNAIGTPGAIDRQVKDTPRGREESIRARGVHLYTRGGLGFYVGAIERRLLFPATGSDSLVCVTPGDTNESATDDSVDYLAEPAIIASNSAGLGLDLNRHRTRFTAGLSSRYELRAPTDGDYVYFFQAGVDVKRPAFCLLNEE